MVETCLLVVATFLVDNCKISKLISFTCSISPCRNSFLIGLRWDQHFAAYFASFHDTKASFYLICYNQLAFIFSQVSAYRQRDHITHQAIAVEMLHNAALWPTSHRHPEWASFIAAFNLPCRNGFKFTEVSIFKDKTQSDL